ncbi:MULTISPECIES: HEPN domain-containing protein [unclassified Methanoculleus]|uniref:HEPN domain-containing protein n=1 Tax=unclassified Methanoculleus TaxID=2619537 RepID=UPI0025FA3DD8|nr:MULTISPECIES: HEPN domain-containing protein [unclassified Methanoculleus]
MGDQSVITALLRKSRQRLDAARILCTEGHHEDAINRAYYAMYLAALALLHRKGVEIKTHAGLISAIGSLYVKTGELPPEHGRALNLIEELREEVDYTICREIMREEVVSIIAKAMDFVTCAELICTEDYTNESAYSH